MTGRYVFEYQMLRTEFPKRAILKMHKSAGLLLGKISISCENKFFDIIIICALKGEYRHFRHCLAGSLFWKISGKAIICHNAQSQS